jgi:putative transcription antitermination factor YqgF
MRYLGIDYGTKRVGIAVSDEEGKIAFPSETLANDKNLADKIVNLCKEKEVGAVVLGESNNFESEENPIMTDVKKLAAKLRKETKLPIILEPEFLTTMQAKRIQGEVVGLDASAAALILQSYLDKIKNKELGIMNNGGQRISYEDFAKVEIKVGKILTAEKMPDADRLLKLTVDSGEKKTRQIIAGIAQFFPDPAKLVGKNCLFVTNLEPRIIRGEKSDGMILALSTEDGAFSLLEPDSSIPIGTRVK